ncbi:MMB_0454 family protein [Mycoplasma elephantis]|uniref:MMB_0454 family protein n=1 Tax=Mycoplasma elephantis TaxID=114882 RepID=UPI000486B2D4|nr:hypothetical protein [Mycoplasma elephantis]
MYYIVRNHSANQAYGVHVNVFKQQIDHLLSKYEYLEVEGSSDVQVTENNNNVKVKVTFRINGNHNVSSVVKELYNGIENIVKLLITSKPENIQLNILN